ncbi:SRPBCC family protein [[Phormidium] sp. ETS-05]|uniref:SRPBCC family protein n=1 Tax=[Phormidium] sp. ETS-05 TaxID=222819 RepID=UPI0018EEF65E|nr:SRPBCC family protein [[Phormidium] sp. ETS-05]
MKLTRTKTASQWGFIAAAIVLCAITPTPIVAQTSPVTLNTLSTSEQTALRNGQTVVTGENGQYEAKILISARPDTVWAVLTDYNNFSRFLPNVVSSQLLSVNGNTKVVEQIAVRSVLGVTVRSRLRTESRENGRSQIDFRLVGGDLKTLQGFWKIESVPGSNQVLLIHQVEAQPQPGIPPGIFYGIFKNSLNPTLNAIRQEAQRRS